MPSRLNRLKSGARMRKSVLRTPRESFPFDFRSLEIFVAVAETGNFTEAGKRFGLTQSAISQTIGRLERELRVRVHTRTCVQLLKVRQPPEPGEA